MLLNLKKPPQPARSINGYSVFCLYLMLSRHFRGNYDVIKYNWKINATEKSYLRRKDRNFFERLSKKYNLGDLSELMISNMVANPNAWIGELSDSDAQSFYRKFEGKLLKSEQIFKEDVDNLLLFCDNKSLKFQDVIMDTSKNNPWLFKMIQQNVITYETFVMLDSLFKFISKYDTMNNIVWTNDYAFKIKGYRSLLNFDVPRIKECFIKVVQENKLINCKN
ncbi:loader of DNA helicase [Citrobacter phage Ci1]|nr:loader of DNA helicase [Citrobacter phage Ci1]